MPLNASPGSPFKPGIPGSPMEKNIIVFLYTHFIVHIPSRPGKPRLPGNPGNLVITKTYIHIK